MMEHSESWMGKRWAQAGAGAGKNEVRRERGFGHWRQEAGGGSRLSLVIRDVQEVYQSQHRTAQYRNPSPTAGR